MALDGQPLEQIEKLLAVAVGTSSLSVHGVVQDVVLRIISALRCLFHSITCSLALYLVCYLCPSFLRFSLSLSCACSLSFNYLSGVLSVFISSHLLLFLCLSFPHVLFLLCDFFLSLSCRSFNGLSFY